MREFDRLRMQKIHQEESAEDADVAGKPVATPLQFFANLELPLRNLLENIS